MAWLRIRFAMNLLKALASTSSFTMLSRVLGLVREAMNARQFGAGTAMDAFVVAFLLPNMFRRIFAEGAFSQAFVPVLAEYRQQHGESASRTFIAHVAGMLMLVLLGVTIIGVLAAPVIVYVSASGFAAQPDKFRLTVELTRITFPYILLISLSSLAGSLLNTWGRFAVPAFTPTLLNISMIGFGLWLAPYLEQPIFALAISVAVGGVAQLLFQLPWLARLGLLVRPRLRPVHPGVWRVMRQMVPALFGVSVAQISLLLNRNFASHLPDGSMSWMNYADRLMELPTGVLGVALGTVLLPSLSRLGAAGRKEDYSATLDWGLRLCWLLALPATVALAVIGEPIIVTLFEQGQFTAFDSQMTQRSLVAYAVGLMGLVSIKILAPGFYAQQDIRTPVRVGIATLILTQVLNLVLIGPLAHAGLALAISLGACFNALVLLLGLRRRQMYVPSPGWGRFLLQLFFAVGAMVAVLLLLLPRLGDWHDLPVMLKALKLGALVAAGAAAYFAGLLLAGVRPAQFSRRVG